MLVMPTLPRRQSMGEDVQQACLWTLLVSRFLTSFCEHETGIPVSREATGGLLAHIW